MNTTSQAHAEVSAMNQAYSAGSRGGNGSLTVLGADVCPTCRYTNVPVMVNALGLDSIPVNERSTGLAFNIGKR